MDPVDLLQMFKKGLAYKKEMAVNWCTSCKCVLANEEVVGGVCERCGSPVERRVKSQWMLKITAYADRLIDDLDLVDYVDRVVVQQKKLDRPQLWRGGRVRDNRAGKARRYTTRPDTLYGATYMVISPEHPYIETWKDKLKTTTRSAPMRARPRRKATLSAARSTRTRRACASTA